MLGDIGRRAAVLPAQCQTLQQPKGEQQNGREYAGGGIGGQESDGKGRSAHDAHGDQEGVFAADQVSESAEYQRPEGPHRESRREGGQCENIARDFVDAREKLRRDDRGHQPVQIEVIPFEHRAQR